MASKTKHMERSRRSYHNPKPFASFENRALIKDGQKAKKETLRERIKALFHRTTNK